MRRRQRDDWAPWGGGGGGAGWGDLHAHHLLSSVVGGIVVGGRGGLDRGSLRRRVGVRGVPRAGVLVVRRGRGRAGGDAGAAGGENATAAEEPDAESDLGGRGDASDAENGVETRERRADRGARVGAGA